MAALISNTFDASHNCHGVPRTADVKRRRVIPAADTHPHRDGLLSLPSSNGGDPLSRLSLGLEEFSGNLSFARAQPLYTFWREVETSIPPELFNFSFDSSVSLEKFRTAGIESVFNYVLQQDLSQTTLHLAAHYINKLFLFNGETDKGLAEDMHPMWIPTAIASAIRTAVKIQEKPEIAENFRSLPEQLWEISNIPLNSSVDKGIQHVNQMERIHLRIIGTTPVNVPVSSDFLEQYIRIGEWPEFAAAEYRQLALFLLALTLFSSGRANPLRGKPPSILAAGALVLAVKIINARKSFTAFEFWPKKLEAFTQYSLRELQPVIHSISKLLRERQKQIKGQCLERMFPYWARFNWN